MSSFEQSNFGFLSGGGEMGSLIRAHDWGKTSLGPPSTWPQGLKTGIRLLLSSGHPMFIWWGPDLIQFYNDAYRRSIGSERHPNALGQPGRDCWAEIWNIIGPQIERVMAGDGPTWHENQLVPITREGRREDVYWTYSYNPLDDPDTPSGIGGVLVVTSETTQQVLAEQRVKTEEARWRALFNQAPGFMCILNGPEHTFEFANPRYFELIGNRDIIGKTVKEALPEVGNQGFGLLLDEVYNSGNAHSGIASPLLLKQNSTDNKQVYIDFVYQPIRDHKGQVTGIFVDGYDVTDRVLSSESLREEDRRKDEFLAMLAHELRNPLAPIRNASELLTQLSTPGSKVRDISDLITRQVMQMTHLVDDLVDVSRITQGRILLQRKPLDLESVIKIAIESVQAQLNEKRHQIFYTASEPHIYINGDMTRIIQCLANVLANAAKYTDVGGRIQISLRKDAGDAIIEITDNGIGIAPEVLPGVFELFVQSERTLDRSQGGLGIGLSIVRRLVQMHGGSITAMSEGLGRGSTFQISLPLTEPPQIVTNKINEEKTSPMRLLIVDDNVDAADSLALLLNLRGHEAKAVYNAKEALSFAPEFGADIVLLDIGLPDIDGYEVARRMRENQSANILVALTGYGKAEDVQRAQEAGFDTHVTKPVAFDHLERILQQYC